MKEPILSINFKLGFHSFFLQSRDLSLQDKDGFEIVRKSIIPVVQGYIGTLKGNFSLEPSQYQRISGAELYFTVYSK